MKTTINIPSNIRYLQEYLTDLPHNCIFDKGKTGAGGTSVALLNDEPYVIAVPFLSLIENKTAQHRSVLGVHGKTKDKEIKDYLKRVGVKKIMVTYDSLPRVMNFINPPDYRLLIDEYHLLFTSYSFRYEAVRCVLDNYMRFKSYCYMTATVLEQDFVLTELQHIPILEYNWETVKEVIVHSLKCVHSVIPTVSNIIEQHLSNKLEGNAHIFVNSVEFIAEMVKLCGLTNENAKGIWSTQNKTAVGIINGSTTTPAKKINFYTSKCFEGVDLNDIDGKTYIVSDKSKAHTMIDISTSVQQICGRLRNTKYSSDIFHIYTTTRYDVELNYEQYKESTSVGIDKAHNYTEQLNNLDKELRLNIVLSEESYVAKRKDIFLFDDNLVKIDLYNYKVTKHLYRLRVSVDNEYIKTGYTVNHDISDNYKNLVKERYRLTNFFKETVLECQYGDTDYLEWAYKKYDFLSDAIKYLGYDKIEEMEYNMSHIKRALLQYSHKDVKDKIKMLLSEYKEIFVGGFISNERLREIFGEIYKQLDLNKVSKSTDILEYHQIKSHQKRNKEKKINGIVILK